MHDPDLRHGDEFDSEEDRQRFRRRYKAARDTEASTPEAINDVAEWFEKIITGRIVPYANTGESELALQDKDLRDSNPRRFRLRVTGSVVRDVSLAYDAGEFEAYLRGLEHGLSQRIEKEADHPACLECGEEFGDGARIGNYCSTECSMAAHGRADE
jgi:hypothetical protein